MNVKGYRSPPPEFLEYDGFETPREYLTGGGRNELRNYQKSLTQPQSNGRGTASTSISLYPTQTASFNDRINYLRHPESPKPPIRDSHIDYYEEPLYQPPQLQSYQNHSAPPSLPYYQPLIETTQSQPHRKFEEMLRHKPRPGDPVINLEAERLRKSKIVVPLPKIHLSTKPPKYDEFGRLMEVADRYALKRPVRPYSDSLELGSGATYENKQGRFIPTYKRYSDNNAPHFPRLNQY